MAEKSETNNNSIISLTLGILSIIIPLIGLLLGVLGAVFSRKAKKQIAKTNENGMGLATSGMICSIVGIVIQMFSVLSLIAFYSMTTIS